MRRHHRHLVVTLVTVLVASLGVSPSASATYAAEVFPSLPSAPAADGSRKAAAPESVQANSPLIVQGGLYYPEDDPIFARSVPCFIFNTLLFPVAIAGDSDIYGDCGAPSITWTLTGPGTLAIHQVDNGQAILSVDGVDVLSLTGGCFAGNIQTVAIAGAGAHTIRIDRMQDVSTGCQYWSWGFDGIEWNGIPPAEPSEPDSPAVDKQENIGTGGDPVQTLSGAFTLSQTDVAIGGRGPSPSLTRSYNSLDPRPGPVGPGWTHGYQARLRHPDDGSQDQMFVGPDGNSDRFALNGDGSYSPPPAVYRTLVRNGDGTFTLTDRSQASWTFDGVGRLTSVSDRYGNASNLTYTGNLLTSVADPAGRGALSLAYTNGLLTSVTDWASPARTVTYQYDGNGRLWKVTDRESQTTTYAYEGTSQRLTSITDARGNVALTLTYDAQARVATQKDAQGLLTGATNVFAYVVNGDGTRVTTVTAAPTSFEPTFSPTMVDTYNAQGFLTSRVARPTSTETLTESYAYDANGFRSAITDAGGNTTNLCYDVNYAGLTIAGSRGNLTRSIGPAPVAGANRPVSLIAYDAKNNVTQTVAPAGVPSGPTVTCVTDLAAVDADFATDLAYDAAAVKLVSTTSRYTDPDSGATSAVTKYEYGDAANPGHVTRIIPPRGNTTATPDYTYATTMTYFGSGTRAGMLASASDALGSTTTYDYDPVGRLASSVGPLGNAAGGVPAEHRTDVTYDREDRVRLVKLPAPVAGGAQLISETRYDEVGNPIVRIDAKGQVTTSTYDERDALRQVKESPNAWADPALPPAGVITTEYSYDAAGLMTRMSRAKGDAANERATDYTYDGRGLVRRETQYPSWPATTASLVATSTYDPNGNLAVATDQLGRTTTMAYDRLNRPTALDYSDPATPDVAYGYDPNNNRTSMTDGTGASSYVYDELDRLTAVTTPGPKTVAYRYDRDGNRTRLIYPDATAVTYAFDKASRMSGLTDWAARTVGYTYFADGALKDATNPNGTVATYAYDNARRLTDIIHKLGTTVFERRTYKLDGIGNILRVASGDVDAQAARPDGFVAAHGTWTGTYASVNETIANDTTFLASPGSPVAANFYEVSLDDALVPFDKTSVTLRYRYAKSGNNAGKTINLTVELRQGSTVIASRVHANIPGVSGSGWQQASLLLTITEATSITDYRDLRVRFRPTTSGNGQARQAQISWSEFGLSGPDDPATAATYGYDRLDRLNSAIDPIVGAATYTYDPIGNRSTRVRGTTTAYTYDRADRITAAGATTMTVNAVGATTARGADSFTYDGVNRLKTATVAGTTETATYDGDGVRFSRQVGAGPVIRAVTDPTAGLPVTIDDGSRKYVWGLGLAYAVAGTAIEVKHADRLGSIRAATDGTGAVIATYRTDEFGIPTASTGAAGSPFRYTGEPLDASGLTYLRARHYDATIGRFLSRDTWPGLGASPASLNRYSYVENNPATNADPSGHCLLDTVADVGFVVFDLITLAFGPSEDRATNTEALALDAAGIVIPCAAGIGMVRRAANAAGAAVTASKWGSRVSHLGPGVVRQIDEAIQRAASGTARFPGHDGKVFKNTDNGLPSAPLGYYAEWTAAAPRAKRGTDRVIIGGNPSAPDAIWYWDHTPGKTGYTQLYP